jgi:predicted TIM-barrel fold metal-dependent hydrolase
MHRIDVHHHYYPPTLMAAEREIRGELSADYRDWTVARAVEELDRGETAMAILSTSSRPDMRGAKAGERLRAIARDSNAFAAGMVRDYPGRFGFFTFLPMPDVEGSLRELAFALDQLDADGVGLMTSYGDAWLGDPAFVPLLEELDRHACVVYVHPLLPECCSTILPYVPRAMLEFPYDTGRTVLSLLFSGAFARFRKIRWIFSHSGGPLPALSGRIETLSERFPKLAEIAPNGVAAEFRRLYCETANAAYRGSLAALLEWVPEEHVLFGSDYPYVSTQHNVASLHACGLSEPLLRKIEHDNAAALFTRVGVSKSGA